MTRNDNRKIAFTLAEVLITLGIIGVVAALTMPVLMANHRKQVVVTRLQKFYSSINQAIKLSEIDNGEPSGWTYSGERLNSEAILSWWNKYLAKYYVSTSVKEIGDGILVNNGDGSGFGVYSTESDNGSGIDYIHFVFCVNADSCQKHLDNNSNNLIGALDGKNTFLFVGDKNKVVTYFSNLSHPDGRVRDTLKNGIGSSTYMNERYGCAKSYKAYCAALIEFDGWRIAPDYPVKI